MKISNHTKQLLEDLDMYRVPVLPKEICRKLRIIYDEQPYTGFDGLLLVNGDQQLIGVSSNLGEESRKTFTCAHELGHYYYDIGSGGLIKCNRDDLGYGKHQLSEKEKRANQFASELLLPSEFFLNDIKGKNPSWDLIQQLSTKYGTSLQATATRYVNLSHHSCWIVVGKGGKLQRFVKADHNEFLVDLNTPFKPPKIKATGWLTVSAENWLFANRRTSGKELSLWPLPENQYGESLMLLWDDGDTLQEENDDSDDDFDDDRYRYD